jgi:hypothetical protein
MFDRSAILQLLSNRSIGMDGGNVGVALECLEDATSTGRHPFEHYRVCVRLN